jgi:hypothetical protein
MKPSVHLTLAVAACAVYASVARAQVENPEVLKKEIETLKEKIELQKEIELLKKEVGSDIKGLLLRMRTENENLDRHTEVLATIKANGQIVAKSVNVARGEYPESTDMPDVTIPLNVTVPESASFTIELVHPGTPGNSDPRWRMTFTVFAIQSNSKKRATSLRLSSSRIYKTKGVTAHLNFEGGNRSSGEMPFSVE